VDKQLAKLMKKHVEDLSLTERIRVLEERIRQLEKRMTAEEIRPLIEVLTMGDKIKCC